MSQTCDGLNAQVYYHHDFISSLLALVCARFGWIFNSLFNYLTLSMAELESSNQRPEILLVLLLRLLYPTFLRTSTSTGALTPIYTDI